MLFHIVDIISFLINFTELSIISNKELIVNSYNNNNTHMYEPTKFSSSCSDIKWVHNEQ